MAEYINRTYRNWMEAEDLIYFQVSYKESDLYIGASRDLSEIAMRSLKKHRKSIEDYIKKNPIFKDSLSPIPPEPSMPQIVREMTESSQRTGTGPMSSVAGAISEYVAGDLSVYSEEVIVENGGDIFITGKKDRKIAIFAGTSSLSGKIAIRISASSLPVAAATSSGTVGPSLSFGTADAVLITSPSGSLSDAAATATGNIVKSPHDFPEAIKKVQNIQGISGLLIICEEKVCIWGDIKLIPVKVQA